MKQLLQELSSGRTKIIEAPTPIALPGTIIINSIASLISAGTERMLVDFGKANYLNKVKQQPEKVKIVLEKARIDGLLPTIDAVRSKLEEPIPLGYSNVGIVAKIGKGVKGFNPGDRVVSNGRHADVIRVPENLCEKIPENVSDEDATFTIIASIGLQGIRLTQPTLGEKFAVIGTGLIGLLTVQMLRAHGCRVLAIDLDNEKLSLAKQFGAETCNPGEGEDPVAMGKSFSKGSGVDGVLICATTKSSKPVAQAARMCRKRGRIVMVGVTGIDIKRSDFYEKELTFQVSCSYGPGRYDNNYEEKGNDYPIGFVRWTEKRNFEAVLEMISEDRLIVKPMITHRFLFDDAEKAYETLSEDKKVLGILLDYNSNFIHRNKVEIDIKSKYHFDKKKPVISFIGAGNYASRVLIPAFRKSGAQLHTIATSGGVRGAFYGKKEGFVKASTNIDAVMGDSESNTVVIATQHDTHAKFTVKALMEGKNVFVEKPLAIFQEDLSCVENAYKRAHISGTGPMLMVGFNRRFSPQIIKIKNLLNTIKEPKSFIMTMNAGSVPKSHWTQDKNVGGGRIIGEACHYIDLMRFLSGSKIIAIKSRRMGEAQGLDETEDKAAIILGFEDGSFGTIHYLSNGHKSFPKEQIEIFTAGKILKLDSFRRLKGFGWTGFKKFNLWRQDKGQKACAIAFIKALENGGPAPIPADEIFEVARATLMATQQLREQ